MKNVFFKIFNSMLDIAQSSVIMWQTLKHGGGGEESQNHHKERILKTNRNSFLVLCACIHKEAVTERKRGGRKLKGDELKGTLELGGRGSQPLPRWGMKTSPSFAEKATEANSSPTLLTKGCTQNLPVLSSLREKKHSPTSQK